MNFSSKERLTHERFPNITLRQRMLNQQNVLTNNFSPKEQYLTNRHRGPGQMKVNKTYIITKYNSLSNYIIYEANE